MRFITLLFSLVLFTSGALAHSTHGLSNLPPLPQDRIEEVADSYVDQLVAGEQIPSSWGDAKRNASTEREYEGNQEWRIHYVNEQIDNEGERDLFLFLTPQGDFLGASHEEQ